MKVNGFCAKISIYARLNSRVDVDSLITLNGQSLDMELPHSDACERNKSFILPALQQAVKRLQQYGLPFHVLEIGSLTAQHAVYFTEKMPEITWQPSDLAPNIPGIQARLMAEPRDNILPPIALSADQAWNFDDISLVYTSNTFHIMSWLSVQHFFQHASALLPNNGVLLVYGPFAYSQQHTSASNAEFDQFLRDRDPLSGIRDMDDINQLALKHDFQLLFDDGMPANNRCIAWYKR